MATNDFTQDLVDKLTEENVEHILITVQKGKEEHKANAYYNITTVDGADMILTTIDEIFKAIDEDTRRDDELEEGTD